MQHLFVFLYPSTIFLDDFPLPKPPQKTGGHRDACIAHSAARIFIIVLYHELYSYMLVLPKGTHALPSRRRIAATVCWEQS